MLSRFTSSSLGVAAVLLSMLPASAGAKTVAPNTGKPGSICAAQQVAIDPPADSGVLDTTSLGPKAAARYTMGAPTSRAESGRPVQRVMMFLHGGGWYTVGQGALNATQPSADMWRSVGWEAVNVDYLPCARSIRSALKMYDLVRAHFGPAVPICIDGDSAGGHLALMIAERRSDVACVITNAAPTDLTKIAKQGAHAVAAGLAATVLKAGAKLAENLAKVTFGKANLNAISPIRAASKITARVLLAQSSDDVKVPAAQAASMARAILKAHPGAYVDTDILSPGEVEFGHGTASPGSVADYYRRVDELVAPFGRAPGHDSPPTLIDSVAKLVGWLLPGKA